MTSNLIINNPDNFRLNIINLINKYFDNFKISKNIEKSIYNYSIKEASQKKVIKKWNNEYFVIIYKNKLRSLIINFKYDNFIQLIKSKSIDCKKIAYMTHQEIQPDKWQKLIELKAQRDKSKYEIDKRIATDEFKCRKCGKNECTYNQMQTRSADEPMTTFVICLNCGNSWKF
jgi:transcription elongation factor S-II